jgi:amino acid transporter
VGIETVAVTAFETKYSHALRRPSQSIAYIVFALYFVYTLGQVLNVKWNNDHLPLNYSRVGSPYYTSDLHDPPSTDLLIIAAWQAGYSHIAGFLNGCLIFSLFFSSTTCLYVASRTLYGLSRDIPQTSYAGRLFGKLGLVIPRSGIPAAALLFSGIVFVWIPFLQLGAGSAGRDVSVCKTALGTKTC